MIRASAPRANPRSPGADQHPRPLVGYTVTATAAVPAQQQGLATGLVTMSQQVGIALGTPVMSALATGVVAATLLPGLQFAIGINAVICAAMATVVAVSCGCHGRSERSQVYTTVSEHRRTPRVTCDA